MKRNMASKELIKKILGFIKNLIGANIITFTLFTTLLYFSNAPKVDAMRILSISMPFAIVLFTGRYFINFLIYTSTIESGGKRR